MNKYELSWMIGSSDLSKNENAILKFFIMCMDEKGVCFPMVSTITEQVKISETTYKTAINNLINMKLVKRTFRYNKITGQQRSNYFRITPNILQATKEEALTFISNAVKKLKMAKNRQNEANKKSIAAIKHPSTPKRSIVESINRMDLLSYEISENENHEIISTDLSNSVFNLYQNIKKAEKRTIKSVLCRALEKTNNLIFKGVGSKFDHIKYNYLFIKKEKNNYI